MLAMITGLSFLIALDTLRVPFLSNDSWLLGFYSPITRAWEFTVGAILALVVKQLIIPRGVSFTLGAFGIGMIVSASLLVKSSNTFPGVWTILPVVGTLLVIAAGLNKDGMITRAISLRPFITFGDLSYSIYLWHWPFIVFAKAIWPGAPP